MRADVGRAESFVEGTPRIVAVGDTQLGIIRWCNELFAIRNICPHMLGPVCEGAVIPRLSGPKFGTPVADRESGVLVCPWHRWEYDLRTGHALRDSRYRLKTYRTWEESGRVMVDTGGRDGGA